ncbi:YfcE family phosphodiesterase [Candidatus Peregrinibacteria bacterium]|nr:YfcE family phosphodiesterase [Candidatus Peregrinibacteria bacterium]
MLLGILSDTHEHIQNIEKGIALFRERGVEQIVHLGDYCAGPSVRAFKGTNITGILGNNDGDHLRIEKNFREIGGDFRWEFCVLECDGLRIACYHGTVPEITEALILCKQYDVVLCGHTHEKRHETIGGVLVINPGSAHGFEKKGTVAILDTSNRKAEMVELL